MGSVGAQIVSAVLLVIGSILATVAILNNQWATEHHDGDLLKQGADGHHWGLWVRCQHLMTGATTCDHYDNFGLGSAKELVAARAGMILGLILNIVALCIITVAIDCCTMVDAPKQRKSYRLTAGIFVIIGGICILAVAIMMFVIIGQHFNERMYFYSSSGRFGRDVGDEPPLTKEVKAAGSTTEDLFGKYHMTFSWGVYTASLAGVFTMISGVLLSCQGCGASDDEDEYQRGIVRDYPNDGYCQRSNEYL